MGVDDERSQNFLPEFDQTTPEGVAKALLWAMEGLIGWYAPHPKKGHYVFRSDDDLSAVWIAHGGNPGEEPRVDFTRSVVVGVFVDEGTYRQCPRVTSVERRGGELVVTIGWLHQNFDMVNPASVVRVAKFDGPVRFLLEAG